MRERESERVREQHRGSEKQRLMSIIHFRCSDIRKRIAVEFLIARCYAYVLSNVTYTFHFDVALQAIWGVEQ